MDLTRKVANSAVHARTVFLMNGNVNKTMVFHYFIRVPPTTSHDPYGKIPRSHQCSPQNDESRLNVFRHSRTDYHCTVIICTRMVSVGECRDEKTQLGKFWAIPCLKDDELIIITISTATSINSSLSCVLFQFRYRCRYTRLRVRSPCAHRLTTWRVPNAP